MNVFVNGSAVFSPKIQEVSFFYFCNHFYETFKKKTHQANYFLRDTHRKEARSIANHVKKKTNKQTRSEASIFT